MTLREALAEVSAQILCGEDEELDSPVQTAAAGDLMSDILARLGTPDVLLTGLTTNQMIRTCAVSGIRSVLVVRDKPVDESIVELAREEDIVLAVTKLSLFAASGRLYVRGMRSGTSGD